MIKRGGKNSKNKNLIKNFYFPIPYERWLGEEIPECGFIGSNLITFILVVSSSKKEDGVNYITLSLKEDKDNPTIVEISSYLQENWKCEDQLKKYLAQ